jgi:hypothetical protein
LILGAPYSKSQTQSHQTCLSPAPPNCFFCQGYMAKPVGN